MEIGDILLVAGITIAALVAVTVTHERPRLL